MFTSQQGLEFQAARSPQKTTSSRIRGPCAAAAAACGRRKDDFLFAGEEAGGGEEGWFKLYDVSGRKPTEISHACLTEINSI